MTAAELAYRVRLRGLRMTDRLARDTLERWQALGIAEQIDGRWRFTQTGRAMFGGWATGIESDEEAA
jgi:hypothetical protein